jgi:hypothetical protein
MGDKNEKQSFPVPNGLSKDRLLRAYQKSFQV